MKNFLQNQEFRFNEVLFENRNKDYGAYVLRNEADKILTKAMFIGLAFFATASVAPLIVSLLKTDIQPTETGVTKTPVWVIPVEESVETPLAVQSVTPTKQDVAQFDSSVPTPAKNPKVEKPAANIKQYDDAVAGTQTIDGVKPTTAYTPPVTAPVSSAPTTVAPAIPVATPKNDEIIKNVDVEADFVGGINSFRNKVMGDFDVSKFEGIGETLRTTVTFVVERDGTISNVKATGPDAQFNREAERTVRNLRGAWKPAQLNGQKVRSYFQFPISMMFE